MNIHSIKLLIITALERKRIRKQKELVKKHMKILRVGDWVATESGEPLGIFDGADIQHSGQYWMNNYDEMVK